MRLRLPPAATGVRCGDRLVTPARRPMVLRRPTTIATHTIPNRSLTKRCALHFVAMEGPATGGNVAKHLGVAPNMASEVVRRLLEKGLLRRQRHEDDERAVALSLTDAGVRTLREHVGLDVAKLDRCLAALPEWERSQIAEGVMLLHQRLEEMDA